MIPSTKSTEETKVEKGTEESASSKAALKRKLMISKTRAKLSTLTKLSTQSKPTENLITSAAAKLERLSEKRVSLKRRTSSLPRGDDDGAEEILKHNIIHVIEEQSSLPGHRFPGKGILPVLNFKYSLESGVPSIEKVHIPKKSLTHTVVNSPVERFTPSPQDYLNEFPGEFDDDDYYYGAWNHQLDDTEKHWTYTKSLKPMKCEDCFRPKFRNKAAHSKGFGSYYNLMWDPRVTRGSERAKVSRKVLEKQKEEAEQEKIRQHLFRPRAVRKAENIAAMKQGLSDFRRSYPKSALQTNMFREVPESYEELQDQPVQNYKVTPEIEKLEDVLPVIYPSRVDKRSTHEKYCQVSPRGYTDSDEVFIDLIARLVATTTSSAVRELAEEEEIQLGQDNHTVFLKEREKELARLGKMKLHYSLILAEAERINKKRLEEDRNRQACESRGCVSMWAKELFRDIKDDALEFLQKAASSKLPSISVNIFVPWLNKEVSKELAVKDVSSRVLENIIDNVAAKREATCALHILNNGGNPIKCNINEYYDTSPDPSESMVLESDADQSHQSLQPYPTNVGSNTVLKLPSVAPELHRNVDTINSTVLATGDANVESKWLLKPPTESTEDDLLSEPSKTTLPETIPDDDDDEDTYPYFHLSDQSTKEIAYNEEPEKIRKEAQEVSILSNVDSVVNKYSIPAVAYADVEPDFDADAKTYFDDYAFADDDDDDGNGGYTESSNSLAQQESIHL